MGIPFSAILDSWKKWGIPALLGLLAPWQNTITGLAIVSEYWQPGLNAFCSVIGALAAMWVFAFLHDRPRAKHRAWAVWLLILFLVSLSIAFGFHMTVGISWVPPAAWQQTIIQMIWVSSYILVFASSAGLIMAVLLAGTNRPRSKR